MVGLNPHDRLALLADGGNFLDYNAGLCVKKQNRTQNKHKKPISGQRLQNLILLYYYQHSFLTHLDFNSV